jgi:hypothetical protein
MDYVLTCVAPTTAPVITGDVVDACTAEGGTVAWAEPTSGLPELTAEGAAEIGAAFVALIAVAWFFRQFKQMISEA